MNTPELPQSDSLGTPLAGIIKGHLFMTSTRKSRFFIPPFPCPYASTSGWPLSFCGRPHGINM